MTTTATDLLPADIVIEPDAPAEAPALSIADHAKAFGPQAEPHEDDAKPELKPIRPVDQQRREEGKFAEGRQRMRSKDAVERINQLTSRAKTAEEQLAAANAELATLRQQRATPAQIATAERKVDQAEAKVERTAAPSAGMASGFTEPEPDENDPKFGGDYGKYLRAAAGWDLRKAQFEERQQQQAAAEQAKRAESERQILNSWTGRVEAAKQKYRDFEQVAFAPTKIPPGSPIDVFIMEDDSGADLLYHLQTHPEELDSLLAMPVLGQLKAMSLLSQRWLPSTSTQAGTTGSATGRSQIVLPHRPPNPVRTEAQRASESPSLMDGSLSIAEHAKRFGPKRR